MVNSYMSYKRYCELMGVPVKWSHHDWNEAIGYAHLDPDKDWPRKKSCLNCNEYHLLCLQKEGPKNG